MKAGREQPADEVSAEVGALREVKVLVADHDLGACRDSQRHKDNKKKLTIQVQTQVKNVWFHKVPYWYCPQR